MRLLSVMYHGHLSISFGIWCHRTCSALCVWVKEGAAGSISGHDFKGIVVVYK